MSNNDNDFRNSLKVNKDTLHTNSNNTYTGSKDNREHFIADPGRRKVIFGLLSTVGLVSLGACDFIKKQPSTFEKEYSLAAYLSNINKDETCLDEAVEKIMKEIEEENPEITLAAMEEDFIRYSELISIKKLSKEQKQELTTLQYKISNNYPSIVEKVCLNSVKAKISDATGINYEKIFTSVSEQRESSTFVGIYEKPYYKLDTEIPLFNTYNNTLKSKELEKQILNIASLQGYKRNGKYVVTEKGYKEIAASTVKTYSDFCTNFKDISLLVEQTKKEFDEGKSGKLITDYKSKVKEDDGR